MPDMDRYSQFLSVLQRRPEARAVLSGGPAYPGIHGTVRFFQTGAGVLTAAAVSGLPEAPGPCGNAVFGFHIHSGERCGGSPADPFADALGHYNPNGCPHPAHAGDLPPLFANHGYAFQIFLTDRFSVREILGKTVIVHAAPDDFTSQPAGNAGNKIACGQVTASTDLSIRPFHWESGFRPRPVPPAGLPLPHGQAGRPKRFR